MINMTSTLVETVSINYEDFNESFLTCGTCLCTYDGDEHAPKLLSCSHSVCAHCLSRMLSQATNREDTSFRCPICRELLPVPRGGVAALPPAFLLNQLRDLVTRQRRSVIPTCSTHPRQELFFCETCDAVFCTACDNTLHTAGGGEGSSSEHIVVPFSIAIKRMSEILMYKANQCINKLNQASSSVENELSKLEGSVESTVEQINRCYDEAVGVIERRRQEMLAQARTIAEEKQKVLGEQIELIVSERSTVERECESVRFEVEVRNLTRRISDLGAKMDTIGALAEPRHNAFMMFDAQYNNALQDMTAIASGLGRIRISSTLPALSRLFTNAPNGKVTVGLKHTVKLITVDLHGIEQPAGGDPVQVFMDGCDSIEVEDCDNGTYLIHFRVSKIGKYHLRATIFDRNVNGSPLFLEASAQHPPDDVYGTKKGSKDEVVQPVAVDVLPAQHHQGISVVEPSLLYVLETGSERITVLSAEMEFQKHLQNDEAIHRHSCTGLAVLSTDRIAVLNWRTRYVTILNASSGETVSSFTHSEFREPASLAATKVPPGQYVIVGDHGTNAIYVFDVSSGHFVNKVTSEHKGKTLFTVAAVAAGPNGEILAADSRIIVFSKDCVLDREIFVEGKNKGRYGGLVTDDSDHLLATRSEKGRSVVQIFQFSSGSLLSVIDSYGAPLKRPSGLAVLPGYHLVVADLGNDCVKKYRYI